MQHPLDIFSGNGIEGTSAVHLSGSRSGHIVGCCLPQMKQGIQSSEGWSLEVTLGYFLL